uniref:Uncharacterized protein n=1 Tax=Lotharella oceanica TaxID=641309 RepID=A0A7S2U5Z1_9EUKA
MTMPSRRPNPVEKIRLKLIARYTQTCVASRSIRQCFLLLGCATFVFEFFRSVGLASPEATLFELASAFAAVTAGLFIGQYPDADQTVFAFKVAFGISAVQVIMFLAHMKGDIHVGAKAWPLGTFFFAMCWGIDRYMLYSLNKSLRLIAELGEVLEGSSSSSQQAAPAAASEATPPTAAAAPPPNDETPEGRERKKKQ